MADPTLLTIDDWLAAGARDGSPREPLVALQRRLETESPPGVWIALVDRAGIESQVASLEVRAARRSDAAALRRTMPLFGVPFAVKDDLDVMPIGVQFIGAPWREDRVLRVAHPCSRPASLERRSLP